MLGFLVLCILCRRELPLFLWTLAGYAYVTVIVGVPVLIGLAGRWCSAIRKHKRTNSGFILR
jgi:hypothetical protein